AKIVRGVPTVGRIANGAIIEREIEFALNRLPNVRLALRNADFTTAKRIAAAINDFLGVKTAEPIDPSTVQLSIPPEFKGNVVAFLTEIEQLQVDPDLAAKIVIDERSGIIVMGRDVRVATVAVAQGNLTVTISESPQVSQPNPLSQGRTVVTPRTSVGVTEDGKKFAVVKDGVSLQQLVDGLNGLGIGPRDLISILQAIKAAGTDDPKAVMAKMRELPIEDVFVHGGKLREDGRVVRDMYLARVKKPSESKEPWDYLEIVKTVKGEDAFRPVSESKCPLLKK
ncbi:MAG: flagellar basal body P-ring protein FlgI, partial [Bradyrhizobium sp.]|nr:flagellar basal body P-ring protein FlgI [Bradyrhizobium sp.]